MSEENNLDSIVKADFLKKQMKTDIIQARKAAIEDEKRMEKEKGLQRWDDYRVEKIKRVQKFVAVMKKMKRVKTLLT
jgi:hypothetical protein